jgi:hypothetical protein
MRAEIKGIFCSDRRDFETWQPDRLQDIYLGLELSIGLTGGEAADLFQVVVATPQAVRGKPERRRARLLIVEQYNWPKIRATLQQWVRECEGQTWDEIVTCLRQRFDWEYEGM